MKKLLLTLLLLAAPMATAADFYDQSIKSINGTSLDLSAYKGKPVLVVNIATQCGYTGQLDGLEKLHDKYKEKGLVVLGIPSNDFGGQTPESETDVAKFCKMNYGVSFPLTAKTVVKGSEKHPLIKTLAGSEEIDWNFEKFLVGKDGSLKGRYKSKVKPSDDELVKAIEAAL